MSDKHYLSLLLHAHLPYVHHPEHLSFLEENWFFEAISETYMPLLQMLERLERDGVPCRLAMTLSSTLLAMLDHPNLQARYLNYLNRQQALCGTLIKDWQCSDEEREVLRNYLGFYRNSYELFQNYYHRNLIPCFRKYRDKGMLELLCTGATHAFLPNFRQYPCLVRQQIRLAVVTFEKYFGKQKSLGFWLPECGYYDDLDKLLVQEGISYSYIALHGLLGTDKLPKNGSFAPIRSPEGLVFFPRERASSAIIWDQRIGYPGAGVYRDFYQDVGYKADLEVLGEQLPFGLRYYTGIKLWRIKKEQGAGGMESCVYQEEKAKLLAFEHAQNFLQHLADQGRKANQLMQCPALISAAYDAELFGHWWNEGPLFLEQLFRRSNEEVQTGSSALEFITPSGYLQRESDFQTLRPCFSSWGRDGYAQVWLDQQNDWIYPQLFELYENIQVVLAQKSIHSQDRHASHEYGPYQQEAIKQLVREFTLACASDWAFMMKSDTSRDYAIDRTNEHIRNTFEILQGLAQKRFDSNWLSRLKSKNRIFPDLDIEDFFL
ncbi:DUF1957 domain-containing protein [Candidatus Haliotispira prima]|uniref:DUF1957 domain-containing protein n=1 Tax=Candidatus Haliotispira prima TaxID=3034016 RepID=A0ABY8MEN8_9SPIO|nr:DUF1957 domain-containing protein [Candidatus Haliotispira prima]